MQLKDEEMKTEKLSLDFRIGIEEAAQKNPLFSQIKTKTKRTKATKSASHLRYDSAGKRKEL